MTTAASVILLTGGTSGIGRVAALKLAERGATVLITGRRRSNGENALAEIRDAHPEGAGAFYRADFTDLDDVRNLATDVEADYDRLDVLCNNAGGGESTRQLTDGGFEHTFALNYVAPFLLTSRLLPRLSENALSRVVTTTSMVHEDGDLSNLDAVATGENFDPLQAYADAKLAAVLFTYELADRLEGTGVRATCFHPGWIPTTDITRGGSLRMRLVFGIAGLVARIAPFGALETHETAADALVTLALDEALPDGQGTYYDRTDRTDPHPAAGNEALRDKLWSTTADRLELDEPAVYR